MLGCGVFFNRKLVCFALDAAHWLDNERHFVNRGKPILLARACKRSRWKCHAVFSLFTKAFVLFFLLSEDGGSRSSILCRPGATEVKAHLDIYDFNIYHQSSSYISEVYPRIRHPASQGETSRRSGVVTPEPLSDPSEKPTRHDK